MTQQTIVHREVYHRDRIKELDSQIDVLQKQLTELTRKKEFHWRAVRNLVSKKKCKGEY